MTTNAAEELSNAIHRELPDASVTIDAPGFERGTWWIDVARGDRRATVEWRPEHGFGVGFGSGGYGEGPDAVVTTVDAAARHVLQYLLSGSDERAALVGSGNSTKRRSE